MNQIESIKKIKILVPSVWFGVCAVLVNLSFFGKLALRGYEGFVAIVIIPLLAGAVGGAISGRKINSLSNTNNTIKYGAFVTAEAVLGYALLLASTQLINFPSDFFGAFTLVFAGGFVICPVLFVYGTIVSLCYRFVLQKLQNRN